MENYSRAEVREFTLEDKKEERQKLATEIFSLRRELYGRKAAVSLKEKEIKDREMDIAWVMNETFDLERKLETEKTSVFASFWNYFENRRVKKEVGSKKKRQEMLELDYLEQESLLLEMRRRLSEFEKLADIKGKIPRFYEEQAVEYEKYLEKKKEFQIPAVMLKYGAFIVHGIALGFVPEENSVLRGETSWPTKIRLSLALEPTLATSSVSLGDSKPKLFSNIGLILNGGEVQSAFPSDAGSRAQSNGERKTHGGKKDEPTTEKLDLALSSDRGSNYNEIVVRKPKMAALYICLDKGSPGEITDEIRKKMEELSKETGLPLLEIKDGKIFTGEGEEIKLTDLVAMQGGVSPETKERLVADIFADSPFQLDQLERAKIGSFGYGKEIYDFYSARINCKPLRIDKFYSYSGSDDVNIPDGAEIEIISELPVVGAIMQIFRYNGRFYEREKNSPFVENFVKTAGRKSGKASNLRLRQEPSGSFREYYYKNPFSSIHTGVGDFSFKKEVTDVFDFLSLVEEKMKEREDKIRKAQWDAKESSKNETPYSDEYYYLNMISFLYGFAEQAKSRGDDEVYKKATEVLARCEGVNMKDLENIKSRIGPKGELRMAA